MAVPDWTQCAAVMGSNLGPIIEARRRGQIRTLTSGFALAELVQVPTGLRGTAQATTESKSWTCFGCLQSGIPLHEVACE